MKVCTTSRQSERHLWDHQRFPSNAKVSHSERKDDLNLPSFVTKLKIFSNGVKQKRRMVRKMG